MHLDKLETERLWLRVPILQDLDALAEICATPAIAQYRTNPNLLNREQTQQKLATILSHWQQHQFGRWAIIDKSSQTFIGHAGLEVPPPEISTDPKEAELSCLIAESYWAGDWRRKRRSPSSKTASPASAFAPSLPLPAPRTKLPSAWQKSLA